MIERTVWFVGFASCIWQVGNSRGSRSQHQLPPESSRKSWKTDTDTGKASGMMKSFHIHGPSHPSGVALLLWRHNWGIPIKPVLDTICAAQPGIVGIEAWHSRESQVRSYTQSFLHIVVPNLGPAGIWEPFRASQGLAVGDLPTWVQCVQQLKRAFGTQSDHIVGIGGIPGIMAIFRPSWGVYLCMPGQTEMPETRHCVSGLHWSLHQCQIAWTFWAFLSK